MESQLGVYKILGEIGHGASGSVRMAQNILSRRNICVKVIPKKNLVNQFEMDFFKREVQILSTLQHKNIVEYIDLIEDSDNYYLFQEFCEGERLTTYIGSHACIADRTIEHIFRQIFAALSYIHKANVGHRDLKPDNIIIASNLNIKIIDFGLSTDDGSKLRTTFCGSLSYAAPECIKRDPYSAWRADIWSLGVVLFQTVTGKLPWKTANLAMLMKQITSGQFLIPMTISPLIREVIIQCLQQDPSKRPSADDLLRMPMVQIVMPEARTPASAPSSPRQRIASQKNSPKPSTFFCRASSNPIINKGPIIVQPPATPKNIRFPKRKESTKSIDNILPQRGQLSFLE